MAIDLRNRFAVAHAVVLVSDPYIAGAVDAHEGHSRPHADAVDMIVSVHREYHPAAVGVASADDLPNFRTVVRVEHLVSEGRVAEQHAGKRGRHYLLFEPRKLLLTEPGQSVPAPEVAVVAVIVVEKRLTVEYVVGVERDKAQPAALENVIGRRHSPVGAGGCLRAGVHIVIAEYSVHTQARFLNHFQDRELLVVAVVGKPPGAVFKIAVRGEKPGVGVHDIAEVYQKFDALALRLFEYDLHPRDSVVHNINVQIGEYEKFSHFTVSGMLFHTAEHRALRRCSAGYYTTFSGAGQFEIRQKTCFELFTC